MRGIADYRFVEELGQGSHGRFHVARTPARLGHPDELCAVKVLDADADADGFRRVANELNLFAAAESPHLVRLLEAGHQDGMLYYATVYHPLRSLADHPELDPGHRLRAVASAARGAHALHEMGVAHRDIKPSNILLTDDAGVLSDLGLAQQISPGGTMTGYGPLGTLAYMEPGVATGQDAGRASDVWSLAATLQVVLTGTHPFPTLPTTNLLDALRHLDSTPPKIAPQLGPFTEVVRRGLAARRSDRYATAADLADAIESITSGDPGGGER